MFFKPTLNLDSHTGAEYDLYSDWHKEAFGCRPGVPQQVHYHAMSTYERQAEHATVSAWFQEDQRIAELRAEVARFDFSRRMEYLMRREGVTEREAFIMACRFGTTHSNYCNPSHEYFDGFDSVCYNWNLPYSDAEVLAAKWAELNA